MTENKRSPDSSPILLAAGAVILVLVAAFAAFAWYQQRRFAQLEHLVETMHREPAAPVAIPVPVPVPAPGDPRRAVGAGEPAPARAEPVPAPDGAAPPLAPNFLSPQGVRFVMATEIRSAQFTAFRAINDDWARAVSIAAGQGEAALPKPLAEYARDREEALAKLLDPEVLKRLHDYERRAPVRFRANGSDGKTYDAVEFE